MGHTPRKKGVALRLSTKRRSRFRRGKEKKTSTQVPSSKNVPGETMLCQRGDKESTLGNEVAEKSQLYKVSPGEKGGSRGKELPAE